MATRVILSLRTQLAVAFGLFVLVGTSAVIVSLHFAESAEELESFAATARTTAAFVENAHFRMTARTGAKLTRVHGFDIAILTPGEAAPELTLVSDPSIRSELLQQVRERPGVAIRQRGFESMLLRLHDGKEMWLARPADPGIWGLIQEGTITVLVAFWLLALGLAIALGRRIIHPLHSLAQQLPSIDRELPLEMPEAKRSDEIGQLARSFLATRQQLAEERTARQRAERMALLARMATGLAHEIQNPVAAIRMHTQLLESAPPAERAELASESLPILLTETARIESLVNQWMFLARPEPPRVSRVELAPIVQQVVALHRAGAKHAGVEIAVDVTPGLAVEGDSRRLGQAVGNVVLNAIQAMAEGGELRITSERSGNVAQLFFRDQGPGFSAEAIEKHTELFFSEKEGGMGVGLNVTAEVLKTHGGTLRVENAPGGGAIVIFELPLMP